MAADAVSSSLKPFGFFDRNPWPGVPPNPSTHGRPTTDRALPGAGLPLCDVLNGWWPRTSKSLKPRPTIPSRFDEEARCIISSDSGCPQGAIQQVPVGGVAS